MSKKSLFKQPGIEQLIPGQDLPIAVKVTGRNMHAVSLVASVSGETRGLRTVVSSYFEKDGSLAQVQLVDSESVVTAGAGEYLLLGDDKAYITVMDADDFKSAKRVLDAVSQTVDLLNGIFAP